MAEKGYIEREEALKICMSHYRNCLMMHDFNGDSIADRIKTEIAALPAADVAHVIKCIECKYFGDAKINKKGYLICPASRMEIGADDFCSYAERKGE